MRLDFSDALIVTNHFDPEMAMLADRHALPCSWFKLRVMR
jgi:hypothetical protein